uniref:CCDC66 domain-containing protein n=1 Tax=Trichuris muris TaxID=70415 RepID=A0A5S6QYE5_TRIMR
MADLGDFSRSESLVERKRRQWAQEKAELQEWYPFGKPGAGAPLKSPLTTMDQSSKCTSQVSANNCQAANLSHGAVRSIVDGFDNFNGSSAVMMQKRVDALPYSSYPGDSVKLCPLPCTAFYQESGQFYLPNQPAVAAAPTCNGFPQAQFACPPPRPRIDGLVPQGQTTQFATVPDSVYPTAVNRSADPSPYAYYHCTAGQTRLMPTNAVPLNCAIPCSSSTPCRTLSIGTAGPCTHGGAYQGWSPINIEMDRVNGMAPPATAYVSPMVFGQQLPQASSNSPSGCDVRSLCSGDGVDCSLLTMHEQAISKSYPGMSDDFGIHKRRAMVTAPKNECDLEEQRARTIQQMKAIDEQIQEKRRKMLEEAERDRRETERIERERQQIELREAMQRKVERSKWKRLQDLEQMRENAVLDSWEKAKEDAAMEKHARLRKHVSELNGEDEFVLVAGLNGVISEDFPPTTNGLSPLSALSDNNSGRSHSQSDFVRTPSRIPASSPADERPIKPLTSSPLEMWDDVISKHRSNAIKSLKKDLPTIGGGGGGKENETIPPKAAVGGQHPLHRSKSDLSQTVAKVPKAKASLRTSIVRPLMRRKQEKTTSDDSTITAKSGGGLGERLSKKLSFRSGKKETSSNGLHHPPSSPSVKPKASSAACSLISQLSASLHIGSSKKSPKQAATVTSSVPLARKNRASVFVPENPFGDSFGGLNPLCQPLTTRRNRRTKRADDEKNEEKLNNDESALDKTFPSSLSNSSSMGECEATPYTFSRSPSLRSPSLSSFNSKSPLYQSVSSKIRCSTESQKKVMEQLFHLRKQLKEKHKAIEDAILKPCIVQKPSSGLATGNDV